MPANQDPLRNPRAGCASMLQAYSAAMFLCGKPLRAYARPVVAAFYSLAAGRYIDALAPSNPLPAGREARTVKYAAFWRLTPSAEMRVTVAIST